MLTLNAKYLEARELPASDPYPPSALVSVLAGSDTLNLIAPHAMLDRLAELNPLDEVSFELRWRRLDLASLGGSGRGKAYRLRIVELLDPREGEV